MENSIVLVALPQELSCSLERWFADNVCGCLLHHSPDDGRPAIAELLIENFVDVALHRFEEAGGSARRASKQDWLPDRLSCEEGEFDAVMHAKGLHSSVANFSQSSFSQSSDLTAMLYFKISQLYFS